MALRIVRPESAKLDLSDGAWLLVKKRLNAGENRRVQVRMIKSMTPGDKKAEIELDPIQVGRSQAMEYLLDWSLSELPIKDKSAEEIGSALDALDPDSFGEISKAIDQHEKAMEAEREAEKNGPDGVSKSPAISPSAA